MGSARNNKDNLKQTFRIVDKAKKRVAHVKNPNEKYDPKKHKPKGK